MPSSSSYKLRNFLPAQKTTFKSRRDHPLKDIDPEPANLGAVPPPNPFNKKKLRSRFSATHSSKLNQKALFRKVQVLQKKNEELAKANELNTELTAMMAHDLKNSIGAIIGLAETNPDEFHSEKIKKLCGYMLKLTGEMVDHHKLETVALKIKPIDGAVEQLIKTAIEQVKGYTTRNVSVSVQLPMGLKMNLDQQLMARVLANLLTNAVVHHPEQSIIELNVARFKGDFIRFSVSDKGKNIPASERIKIFEKYYQAGGASRTSIATSGLGLSFCKLAVEAHGGEIGVEPNRHTGNTFWFTLPYRKPISWKNKTLRISLSQRLFNSIKGNEKEILQAYLPELKRCKIYEISRIKRTLQEIEADGHQGIYTWKKLVMDAVYTGNQFDFDRLLNGRIKI